MARELNVTVMPVNRPEDAIENAETIFVSTNSPGPALLGKWLKPECLSSVPGGLTNSMTTFI